MWSLGIWVSWASESDRASLIQLRSPSFRVNSGNISIWGPPASAKFAVAYVWSDADVFFHQQGWAVPGQSREENDMNYLGPFASGMGLCALAHSALASLGQLANTGAEAVVLTDNMKEGDEEYLRKLGVRVVRTNLTELYTFKKLEHIIRSSDYYGYTEEGRRHGFFKERSCMLKAGLAALDYELLVYLDVDTVAVRPPSLEVLGMKGWEMFSYTVENAPISGGDFLLRPSHGAFHDMIRLMDVGFSRDLGWGKLGLPVEKWGGLRCQFASNHHYCQEKPDFNHWDFLAAEGDKGIMYASYGLVRRTLDNKSGKRRFQKWAGSFGFYGMQKPWMPQPCSYNNGWLKDRIELYWQLYANQSRPKMQGLRTSCVARMDAAWESFKQCATATGQGAAE